MARRFLHSARLAPLFSPPRQRLFSAEPSQPSGQTSSSHHPAPKFTQTYEIPKLGKLKVSLDSKATLGVAQSRGERPYQEDFVTYSSLDLKDCELQKTIASLAGAERVGELGQAEQTSQTLFVGVIDGHGGSEAAEYLCGNLGGLVERCAAEEVPGAIRSYRAIGGYFRRFRGGYLEGLGEQVYANGRADMGLDERLALAFLLADQHLIGSQPSSGAVTTVALLSPLPGTEEPSRYPFFGARLLALTLAHVGDTLALLCAAGSGKAVALTENHHPESRVESERLRRIGTGLITDSFGESRWGGSLANSRGLGDAGFKKLGVTGEPDLVKRILKGNYSPSFAFPLLLPHASDSKNSIVFWFFSTNLRFLSPTYSGMDLIANWAIVKQLGAGDEWAFLVLVSDGISNVISNQEIVDLCRQAPNPAAGAEQIVGFAEQLGGRDNMSAVVVPLLGWGNVGDLDRTAERRLYRLRQLEGQSSGRARRM